MAAPLDNTQAVAVEIERVHKALKPLFERSGVTWKLIQERGDAEIVSNRAVRIPLELAPPGNFRQADFNGGDLGRGGGTQYIFATVTTVPFVVALETTKLAEIGTNSSQKAIADVVRKDMKNGVKEMRWGLDALAQGSGTGQLSTLSSGAGTTTWTLSGNFKTLLLHRGLRVQLYDTTFTTQRVGVATIQAVNFSAGTVVVDVNPAGATNGDLIVIEGMSGASPTTLNGLRSFQTDATTGTTLGLTRSLYPEIQAQTFNANGSFLNPTFVRLALNKLRIKRDDDESMQKLVAHCNVHQTDAYEQNAQLAAVIYKDPTAKQGFDLFFKTENMAGVPIKTNIKADPTIIDFLELSRWFRAVVMDIDFYRDPGGGSDTVFPLYGASGGRASSSIWYMATMQQIVSEDPGFGTFIQNLAKPAGYP
jgi:hypothetical protein